MSHPSATIPLNTTTQGDPHMPGYAIINFETTGVRPELNGLIAFEGVVVV